MLTTPKLLIGTLVALNAALIGMLLFREQSVIPAQANAVGMTAAAPTTPAGAAPLAAAAPLVERDGGTSFLPATASAPAPVVEPAPVAQAEPAPVAQAEPVVEPAPVQATVPAARTRPAAPVATKPRTASPAVPAHKPEPVAERDLPAAEAQVASLEPPRDLPIAQGRPQAEPARPLEPQPEPKPVTVAVAAGRNLPVRLTADLNSRQLRIGDTFAADLVEEIVIDGVTLARAGDSVTGQVTDIRESGKVKGLEQLSLTLTEITLSGKRFPIEASVVTLTAKDDKARDAKVVGGAAAVGAIIGAIANGKKGAAQGAAAGAAAGGGVVLSTRGRPVELARGAELDFTLSKSVRVTLRPSTLEGPSDDGDDPSDEGRPAPEPKIPGVAQR